MLMVYSKCVSVKGSWIEPIYLADLTLTARFTDGPLLICFTAVLQVCRELLTVFIYCIVVRLSEHCLVHTI